ncbi:hypothetical protein [Hydrogenimonas sp. SS33]|uniref:hypothetical protein n=1 Tax=Hydrogenimonas leucolamina TaxID=2954236 RepID=UPI00336BECEB
MKPDRLKMRWQIFIGFIAALSALSLPLAAEENLSALLDEYAQQADLSNLTKQESAGNLIVYTRRDLERMQIKQLKELLEKIPFLEYKEDNYGLTDVFYAPYQPASNVGIKLYVNDRAMEIPYGGNALRLYAQMDMSYIDHVEIYLGAPALSFGVEQGAFVIKLYTKDPARENTDVLGVFGGTYGTRDLYAYSAHVTDGGIGYLLYANYFDLRRHKVRTGKAALSRDKEFGHFYSRITKGNHAVEFEAIRARFDQFYGMSFHMDPKEGYPYSYATNLYGGYYYDNQEAGVKGFINYAVNRTDFHDASRSGLGIMPNPKGAYPAAVVYDRMRMRFNDYLLDTQIRKKLKGAHWESDTGLQFRHKRFKFPLVSAGDVENHNLWSSTEIIYSLFNETSYQPDPSNIFLFSVKGERYNESDDVNDRTQLFYRIGYTYSTGKWTSKNFLMSGDFTPTLDVLFRNYHIFGIKKKLDSTEASAASTQLIYKEKRRTLSLLLAATKDKNHIYYDVKFDPTDHARPLKPYYANLPDPIYYYTAWADWKEQCTPEHRIVLDGWLIHADDRNSDTRSTGYGAQLSHSYDNGEWSLFNEIVYRYFPGYDPGWDWNLAATWHLSRDLTLIAKANNILGEALQNHYTAFDPTPIPGLYPPIVTTLNNVDAFDRRLWIGLEYQF